jgi:MmyB-like transcription regulator ligand binding domain
VLRQHEPFLAVAMDRRWDVVMCNGAYAKFLALIGDGALRVEPYRVLPAPRLNSLKLLFGPYRHAVANWDEVATCTLDRARREAVMDRDRARRRILEECVANAPAGWTTRPLDAPAWLVIPVELAVPDLHVRLFCITSTLGTAQDITLQELRVETFHPADEESERQLRAAFGAAVRSVPAGRSAVAPLAEVP